MQIDWWTLAIQTVNFLVVVWLLSRFLYRPVRRMIAEREAADRAAAEEAAQKAQAAEALKADYEARLADLARAQRQKEDELSAAMQAERDKMLEAARTEAEGVLAAARERIARERDSTLAALRDDIAALARDLAGRALAAAAEDPVDAVTAHLGALPDAALADLRRDLAGDGAELRIVTARPLASKDEARWRAALAGYFDPPPRISFAAEPSILGGVELRFPHAVLGFSVADRLARLARAMTGAPDAA